MKQSIFFLQAILATVLAAPVSQEGRDGIHVTDNGDLVILRDRDDLLLGPNGLEYPISHNWYGIPLEEESPDSKPLSRSPPKSPVRPIRVSPDMEDSWDGYRDYHNGRPIYYGGFEMDPRFYSPRYYDYPPPPYAVGPPHAPQPTVTATKSVTTSSEGTLAPTVRPNAQDGSYRSPIEVPHIPHMPHGPHGSKNGHHFEEAPNSEQPLEDPAYHYCTSHHYIPESQARPQVSVQPQVQCQNQPMVQYPQQQQSCGLSGCLRWLKCPFSKFGNCGNGRGNCGGGNCGGGNGGNCGGSSGGCCFGGCNRGSSTPQYYYPLPPQDQTIPPPLPETAIPPFEVPVARPQVVEPFPPPPQQACVPVQQPYTAPVADPCAAGYYPQQYNNGGNCQMCCGSQSGNCFSGGILCPWKCFGGGQGQQCCNNNVAPQSYNNYACY